MSRVHALPWSGAVAGSRCLVSEVVRLAIVDMRKPCPILSESDELVLHLTKKWRVRHREAVLFLGSSACTVWLSMIGLEATRVLAELRWREYAAGLLEAEPGMYPRDRLMLEEGVRRMGLLARRAV